MSQVHHLNVQGTPVADFLNLSSLKFGNGGSVMSQRDTRVTCALAHGWAHGNVYHNMGQSLVNRPSQQAAN